MKKARVNAEPSSEERTPRRKTLVVASALIVVALTMSFSGKIKGCMGCDEEAPTSKRAPSQKKEKGSSPTYVTVTGSAPTSSAAGPDPDEDDPIKDSPEAHTAFKKACDNFFHSQNKSPEEIFAALEKLEKAGDLVGDGWSGLETDGTHFFLDIARRCNIELKNVLAPLMNAVRKGSLEAARDLNDFLHEECRQTQYSSLLREEEARCENPNEVEQEAKQVKACKDGAHRQLQPDGLSHDKFRLAIMTCANMTALDLGLDTEAIEQGAAEWYAQELFGLRTKIETSGHAKRYIDKTPEKEAFEAYVEAARRKLPKDVLYKALGVKDDQEFARGFLDTLYAEPPHPEEQ